VGGDDLLGAVLKVHGVWPAFGEWDDVVDRE
jgi:hypothetical protein